MKLNRLARGAALAACLALLVGAVAFLSVALCPAPARARKDTSW